MLTLEDIRALQAMAQGYVSARPWIAEINWDFKRGWLVGSFGNSTEDGEDWSVHTRPIPASETPYADSGADARFVAALVNASEDLLALAAERLGAEFVGQCNLFGDGLEICP